MLAMSCNGPNKGTTGGSAKAGADSSSSAKPAAADETTRFCTRLGEIGNNLLSKCTDADRERTSYAFFKGFTVDADKTCKQVLGDRVDVKAPDKCLEWAAKRGMVAVTLLEAEPSCDGVFVGKQPVGADCESSLQCVSGSFCDSGKCSAPKGEGGECRYLSMGQHTSCAAGLTCVLDKPADPQTERCQKTLEIGAECDPNKSACGDDRRCFDGKCHRLGAAGDECTDGGDCSTGLFCTKKSDQDFLGRCALMAATGQPCGGDSECTSAVCKKNDGEPTGVCVPYCGIE